MKKKQFINTLSFSLLFTGTCGLLHAADWPTWGRDTSRNMYAAGQSAPSDFSVGTMKSGTEEVDMTTTKGVRWVAKLGSQAYGNPTVADGRVYVGTNNESPRDPKTIGDRGIVMCFDEKTGAFLWQLSIPKLGAGKVSDWEYIGVCSSPAVEGDRAYVVTNRCQIVCLDVNGLKNGNDGPFKDEGKFMAGPGQEPVAVSETDADIIWVFDMREELGVFPHNVTSSSPLIVGDLVFAATSNGVDWSHTNKPSPFAPSFCVVNKKTGELAGEEASGASGRALHASWSSLTYGKVAGEGMVIWGGSDGLCYGYDPIPVKGEDEYSVMKELWRFDCNAPSYRLDEEGKPRAYATPPGPSECIGTPVLYNDKIYVAIGQDPEHGDGVGMLSCIDPTQRGDISKEGAVWQYKDVGRTMSTVSITEDGLVFVAEYAGKIHCVDANTGEAYWVHDCFSRIWGSTLVVDGKVFLGNEDGTLLVLSAGKEKKVLAEIDFGAPIYSSPIIANDTLYVGTQTHLYAIDGKSVPTAAKSE